MLTQIEQAMLNKGFDIRHRNFRPTDDILTKLGIKGVKMTITRFHAICSGKKPMWFSEAIQISEWLEVPIEVLADDQALRQHQE